jgi:prevent-host-death family protein
MVTITSAELQKQFGKFRDMARRVPVSVTHHGRDDLVVMAAEEYRRLKSLDDRIACHPSDLPPDLLQALDDQLERMKTVKAADLPVIRA